MNYKKILLSLVICGSLFAGAGTVSAVDNSALIQLLLQQIAALQAQLTQLQAQQGTTVAWCHAFNTNMGIGTAISTSDLDALIMVLDKEKKAEGKVLAVGDGEKIMKLGIKEGDRVIFGKYAGEEVKIENKEYKVLGHEDVLAKII